MGKQELERKKTIGKKKMKRKKERNKEIDE